MKLTMTTHIVDDEFKTMVTQTEKGLKWNDSLIPILEWATMRVEIHVEETLTWREMQNWCSENCIGRWQVWYGLFFELESDLILFKLRWL